MATRATEGANRATKDGYGGCQSGFIRVGSVRRDTRCWGIADSIVASSLQAGVMAGGKSATAGCSVTGASTTAGAGLRLMSNRSTSGRE